MYIVLPVGFLIILLLLFIFLIITGIALTGLIIALISRVISIIYFVIWAFLMLCSPKDKDEKSKGVRYLPALNLIRILPVSFTIYQLIHDLGFSIAGLQVSNAFGDLKFLIILIIVV